MARGEVERKLERCCALLVGLPEEPHRQVTVGARNSAQSHIVLDVGSLTHSYDRGRYVRCASNELKCGSRFRGCFGKCLADEGWNVSDQSASVEGRACHDDRSRILQAIEDGSTMSIRAELTLHDRAFAHGETKGQLKGAQVVVGAADVECDVEEIDDRQVAAIGVRQQETIPGREPVGADPAFSDGVLQRFERSGKRGAESIRAELSQMDFRFLNQVVVDRFELQVPATTLDLIEQEPRCDRMAASDVTRVEDSRIQVARVEIAVRSSRIVREFRVRGQRTPLRHDHDFVSGGGVFSDGACKRMPQRSLARLHAIR